MLWLLASQWPGFEAGAEMRGQLSAMIIAAYTWLTAYEFWRGAQRAAGVALARDRAVRRPHGAMFLLRTPLNALLHGKDADTILASAWLSVLSLEAFLMTIATAFILLAMSKERTELRHKTAAMTDPLTGLLNRRAFLQDAEALLQQQISRDRPIGVLLIDLDHFKSINDRFGHAAGDKVLQIFAKTAQANLRQTDLVGRLGGEEFTVVLADASIDNAYLVADRLRNAFAVAAAVVDGAGAARDREHRRVGDRRSEPGSRQAHHARRSGALSRQGARPQPRRGRADRDRSRRRGARRPARARRRADGGLISHAAPRHAAPHLRGRRRHVDD